MRPVLILGGYGNFGKRIARALTNRAIPVVISGRDITKAKQLQNDLPDGLSEIAIFDANTDLPGQLLRLKPSVVVNTCGPFQQSDYTIATACIDAGVHCVDLADGRDFVTGIKALDVKAKARNVTLISGASTVPGLSSAVVKHFKDDFTQIDEMRYGISPGQQAERGLATTKGILSYVGRPLRPFAGGNRVFGWQDIYRQRYPGLGRRWMANCDVPDLDLLPLHYGIKNIRFSAGLELGVLHLGLWALAWLVRLGLPLNLQRWAEVLLWASDLFNGFGSDDGGMHVTLTGLGQDGKPLTRQWFIIAKDGHGPEIPTIPAIVLAADLALGRDLPKGALACVGMLSLTRYLKALDGFSIKTYDTCDHADMRVAKKDH